MNNIWEFVVVVVSRRSFDLAIIIPIPKPGKDITDLNNYRPIALISCICKTMERMINRCLVCFLEKNNILTNIHCGFRKTAALSINL